MDSDLRMIVAQRRIADRHAEAAEARLARAARQHRPAVDQGPGMVARLTGAFRGLGSHGRTVLSPPSTIRASRL